jgi:hypothetical protein
MLNKLFNTKNKVVLGMIHLPPLLSYPDFPGLDFCIQKSLEDLKNLQEAGFDGVLIENDYDQPHTEFANPAQISAFTAIAWEVCKRAKIPVGVQMMLNDWKSSFAIAKVVGAKFTRLDVFIDHVTCQWGEMHPNPSEIMDYKTSMYPELLLFADIQVKYKTMLEDKSLATSAKQAIEAGANALIVTGEATGKETPIEKIKLIKKTYPNFPLFIGSGIHAENVQEQLQVADGAIVGTSIKTGNSVDLIKAKGLMGEVVKLRKSL